MDTYQRINLPLGQLITWFSELAETNKEVYWIKSLDFQKVIYVSKSYQTIWGRSCESLHANPGSWFDAIVEDEQVIASQKTYTYKIQQPSGAIRQVYEKRFIFHDESQQISIMAGISRDISDNSGIEELPSSQRGKAGTEMIQRLAATETAKQNQVGTSLKALLDSEYFTRLAEKSRSVFWIRSADYKIQLYVSPAYETIWGRSRQALYENPDIWSDYLHPEDTNRMAAELPNRSMASVNAETIYDEKYRIIRPDGEIRYIKDTSFPIFNNLNNCIGFAGIAEDITNEKIYEQSLIEAKDRAEAANMAKSEFLAMISHELRIPLTGIIGMAQLLSVDCLLPGQRDQVEDIIKASEHLLSLVNDLLDLTRLEAGKIELQPAPLDLRRLIEDITNILIFQAKVKGLELLVDYQGDVPNQIVGDARALRQILLNLLGNAVKFTDQGHIVIAVKVLRKMDEQALLEIIVKDTGIGIPSDKLRMIFDRFKQVDSSYSRRYGGLGMGLTLSKAYVELMGGHMEVDSRSGQGSTFTCTIPFALQAYSDATSSTWDSYKSHVRVLIVDDTLRGEVLYKHIGSSLAQLTLGAEALNVLLTAQRGKEPFDIVIIDQQLSSIDAMQLGTRINSQAGLTTRPMLLLLMPPSPITAKERAKAAGFFDCLTKPVHPSELLTTLTAAWEKWKDKNNPEKKMGITPIPIQWRVLLVEDSPVVQRVHVKMLEKLGCQVDLAENALQALAMSANDYDIIFMDVGLPEMSGLEVTEEIRRREKNRKHIPIIAITGFAHEEDRKNCLAVGMDDVAVKPIKPEELKELLIKWGAKTPQKQQANANTVS